MTTDLDKRARELFGEISQDQRGFACHFRLSTRVVTEEAVHNVIKAALSESARPAIDLEQFRPMVEAYKMQAEQVRGYIPKNAEQRIAEANRLLALIDEAGKEKSDEK